MLPRFFHDLISAAKVRHGYRAVVANIRATGRSNSPGSFLIASFRNKLGRWDRCSKWIY